MFEIMLQDTRLLRLFVFSSSLKLYYKHKCKNAIRFKNGVINELRVRSSHSDKFRK